MKPLLPLIISGALCACSAPAQPSSTTETASDATPQNDSNLCIFTWNGLERCTTEIDGRPIVLDLKMGELRRDERSLASLEVQLSDSTQTLTISEQTSILEGERGFVRIEDINFNGHADIALTTSFGVANLYLDYWLYEPKSQRFVYLGNFPELKPDPEKEVLVSTIRLDAANYRRQKWRWQNGDLRPADQ